MLEHAKQKQVEAAVPIDFTEFERAVEARRPLIDAQRLAQERWAPLVEQLIAEADATTDVEKKIMCVTTAFDVIGDDPRTRTQQDVFACLHLVEKADELGIPDMSAFFHEIVAALLERKTLFFSEILECYKTAQKIKLEDDAVIPQLKMYILQKYELSSTDIIGAVLDGIDSDPNSYSTDEIQIVLQNYKNATNPSALDHLRYALYMWNKSHADPDITQLFSTLTELESNRLFSTLVEKEQLLEALSFLKTFPKEYAFYGSTEILDAVKKIDGKFISDPARFAELTGMQLEAYIQEYILSRVEPDMRSYTLLSFCGSYVSVEILTQMGMIIAEQEPSKLLQCACESGEVSLLTNEVVSEVSPVRAAEMFLENIGVLMSSDDGPDVCSRFLDSYSNNFFVAALLRSEQRSIQPETRRELLILICEGIELLPATAKLQVEQIVKVAQEMGLYVEEITEAAESWSSEHNLDHDFTVAYPIQTDDERTVLDLNFAIHRKLAQLDFTEIDALITQYTKYEEKYSSTHQFEIAVDQLTTDTEPQIVQKLVVLAGKYYHGDLGHFLEEVLENTSDDVVFATQVDESQRQLLIELQRAAAKRQRPEAVTLLDYFYTEHEELRCGEKNKDSTLGDQLQKLSTGERDKQTCLLELIDQRSVSLISQYVQQNSAAEMMEQRKQMVELHQLDPAKITETYNQKHDTILPLLSNADPHASKLKQVHEELRADASFSDQFIREHASQIDELIYTQVADLIADVLPPKMKKLWLDTDFDWPALLRIWSRAYPYSRQFATWSLVRLGSLENVEAGLVKRLLVHPAKNREIPKDEKATHVDRFTKSNLAGVSCFARYPVSFLLDTANLSIHKDSTGVERLEFDPQKMSSDFVLMAIGESDFNGAFTVPAFKADGTPNSTSEALFTSSMRQLAEHKHVLRVVEISSATSALKLLLRFNKRYSGAQAIGLIVTGHGSPEYTQFSDPEVYNSFLSRKDILAYKEHSSVAQHTRAQQIIASVKRFWSGKNKDASTQAELQRTTAVLQIFDKLLPLFKPHFPTAFTSCSTAVENGVVAAFSETIQNVSTGPAEPDNSKDLYFLYGPNDECQAIITQHQSHNYAVSGSDSGRYFIRGQQVPAHIRQEVQEQLFKSHAYYVKSETRESVVKNLLASVAAE